MPATEAEIEQLLAGAATGNAYEAFGLHYNVSEAQLEAECRHFQKRSTRTKGTVPLFRTSQMLVPLYLLGKRVISATVS